MKVICCNGYLGLILKGNNGFQNRLLDNNLGRVTVSVRAVEMSSVSLIFLDLRDRVPTNIIRKMM